jgi:hypothetical protein
MTSFVGRCSNQEKKSAVIYRYNDCEDDSMRVDLDNPELNIKHMGTADIKSAGLPDDTASSVLIPPGYELTIY